VEELGSLERDDIVCVSSQRRFIRPRESQRFIELKASWTRACKQRGHRPSDANDILFTAANTTGQTHNKVTHYSRNVQPKVALQFPVHILKPT